MGASSLPASALEAAAQGSPSFPAALGASPRQTGPTICTKTAHVWQQWGWWAQGPVPRAEWGAEIGLLRRCQRREQEGFAKVSQGSQQGPRGQRNNSPWKTLRSHLWQSDRDHGSWKSSP